MKLTGIFKDYDGLKAAYGLQPGDVIEDHFDGFLKKIAGQECILGEYSPIDRTFNTTLYGEDPERPGSGKMVHIYLDGLHRRYGDNISIDTLASVTKVDADKYIYCTNNDCGFTIAKETRWDFVPELTYGDIYDGNVEYNTGNIVGTQIIHNAIGPKPHQMYCPKCRQKQIFDEVGNSLP